MIRYLRWIWQFDRASLGYITIRAELVPSRSPAASARFISDCKFFLKPDSRTACLPHKYDRQHADASSAGDLRVYVQCSNQDARFRAASYFPLDHSQILECMM